MEVRVQRGLIAQRLGAVVGDGQRHGQLLADFDVVDRMEPRGGPGMQLGEQFGRRVGVGQRVSDASVVGRVLVHMPDSGAGEPVLRLLTGDFAMLETECEPWQYHGHASADRFAQIDGLGLPYGGMAARGRPGEHVSAEIADLRGTVFIGDVANSKRSNHRSQYMPMPAFENTYLGHSCFLYKMFEHL